MKGYCDLPGACHLPKNGMKLECVITCVNHADFLAHTIPLNKHCFDRIVVVSAPEDRDTPRICDYWQVECCQTDAFNSRWGEFKKGCGINAGLAALSLDDWVCHLDADIALPPNSRFALEHADLDPSMIYGIDRVDCKSYTDWQRFIGNPVRNVDGAGWFIHTTHSPFKLSTRVKFGPDGGYVPIGFFQLWHPKTSGMSRYLEGHNDAGREDSMFPAQWPRSKRGFIPEVTAYHLESEDAPMAANWQGRKTKPFQIG
jgi:hypothetical protein